MVKKKTFLIHTNTPTYSLRKFSIIYYIERERGERERERGRKGKRGREGEREREREKNHSCKTTLLLIH